MRRSVERKYHSRLYVDKKRRKQMTSRKGCSRIAAERISKIIDMHSLHCILEKHLFELMARPLLWPPVVQEYIIQVENQDFLPTFLQESIVEYFLSFFITIHFFIDLVIAYILSVIPALKKKAQSKPNAF
jgi:hypothetical protein